MKRFLTLFTLITCLAGPPAAAEPTRYQLDPDASRVTFTYTLSGRQASGTMPITKADLFLDFGQVARSSATVTLDVGRARTGVVFVTEALKSAQVLDARAHPAIRFRSRSIRAIPGGARLTGDVTIRGVTQPLTLDAKIYRPPGTAEGDRRRLTLLLSGQVDRSAFGATGYANLVEDTVDLDIVARVIRQDG